MKPISFVNPKDSAKSQPTIATITATKKIAIRLLA